MCYNDMQKEGGKMYHRHLTDEEWNAISDFTHDAKCDEVFDICTDENGDYFWDFEEDCMLPFDEGLYLMACDIAEDGVIYARKDKEHRQIIGEIFEKYCSDEHIKQRVRMVNENLNKKFAN